MLQIIIAWILVVANAPWWIWLFFSLHILGDFISFANNIIKRKSDENI